MAWQGQAPTHGIEEHIEAMKSYVPRTEWGDPTITSHPIKFGSEGGHASLGNPSGSRMVTVAKSRPMAPSLRVS